MYIKYCFKTLCRFQLKTSKFSNANQIWRLCVSCDQRKKGRPPSATKRFFFRPLVWVQVRMNLFFYFKKSTFYFLCPLLGRRGGVRRLGVMSPIKSRFFTPSVVFALNVFSINFLEQKFAYNGKGNVLSMQSMVAKLLSPSFFRKIIFLILCRTKIRLPNVN